MDLSNRTVATAKHVLDARGARKPHGIELCIGHLDLSHHFVSFVFKIILELHGLEDGLHLERLLNCP